MNRRVLSRAVVWLLAVALPFGLGAPGLRADNTPQTLPFAQDWSNPNLITAANDWSGVPGIIGYRGDDITTSVGADPRLLLADGTNTPVNVLANQTNPNTLITGGIAEFDTLPNPTVALQGSGTADAPFLLINLNTLGRTAITVSYNVRDVDGSADNTNQQVALHYRVGSSGNFTNVPAAYIADATTGPNLATLVTPISVVLPADAENQPLVQIRIMTTNAPSNDEWVGIDDISVTGTVSSSTNPSGTGIASPNPALVGGSVLLTVAVTPGTNPSSTGIQVSADLSSIGGSSAQAFHDDGGNSFSFTASIPTGTTPGAKSLPVTITDEQLRTGTTSISLTLNPPPPPVGHPVISQIYGGGGNSGATFQNDFVELYNPGTTPFDLTGWSIQYASATGSFSASNLQPLAGLISPGEYYLVALASGGANGDPLPVLPNVAGAINMSATTGKVALVSNSDPLTGGAPPDCPSTDGDLIDFVGYGGANCREGAANAPAPSNSTAILRNNGGATDTDQNGADFATGTPNPRRTSPIAEVGPFVQSTDPTRNASEAPRDASMTITFSEDVFVDPSWFHIACATTGDHDDATVAGGPRTFVITPNVNFLAGESCTVTLFKDTVHDVDTDDSGPNTDTLAADYVWSFTVATGAAPAYPPEVHLTMGNPSGAVPELDHPDNYLMSKAEFALSYNRELGRPNWVSWHLDDTWVGNLTRVDTFRPDPAVPPDWYRVQATDFFNTGFDRGHMTPNADRDNENSIPINQATFLMSNMVAQAPDNNQGPWANLENYLRTLLPGNELYIVSGPAGAGGTGSSGGVTTTVAGGHVTVPAFTWKVALVLPKEAGDDVSRVSASTRTIAVIMPNTQGIRTSDPNDWQTYLTTVDAVEALTGYDFFSNVDSAVQNAIEAGVNGNNPPGVADQVVRGDEDAPQDFTLRAVSASSGPLTYIIDTPPVHGAVTGTDASRTYVPVADFFGTDSFTFHVSDGTRTSNTATVTVQVAPVNDPPVAAGDARVTDEDTTLVFAASDLTANDVPGPANESGQALTVTSVSGVADTHGAVTLSGGQVTYVPEPDFNGTAHFDYQVCDDGLSGGVADPRCATATVEVTVNPVNDPPVFTSVPGTVTIPEGAPYTFTVQAHDVDSPSLTFSLLDAPAGAAIDPVSGQLSWTPSEAQGGTGAPYTFTVRVSDGTAVTDAPVVITVAEVNTPPGLSLAGHYTIPYGQLLAFTAAGSDVDLPAQTLSYGLSGVVPAGAAIDPVTGAFTWTPAPAQAQGAASYAFGVFVSDGIASATVSVTIDVTDPVPPVLTLPSGVTAIATSPAGAVVTYTASASDAVDGDRPVACLPASGATFAIGTTSVSCSASDTHGNTATGSFTVTVTTATVPGRMVAEAAIDLGSARHDFTFLVREHGGGNDFGTLVDRVTTRGPGGNRVDLFVSTAITSVAFFNVPGVSPGPLPLSGVDTVSFGGVGRWNGQDGYSFEAVALDGGEPGPFRDAFRITVRDAAGNVVATVRSAITSGNIQSLPIVF